LKAILLALSLLLLVSCSAKQTVTDGYSPLTAAEVTEALRDALGRSIARGVAYAAVPGGFYDDPRLSIDFPPGTEKMQNTLGHLGLGAQIDRTVLQINRAAELTASRARQPFLKAITALDIDDPFEVLNGAQDAATRLLTEEAGDDLYAELEPIVANALIETGAAQNYSDLAERYSGLPLVFDVDPDIAAYVSEKTVDGLLVLMAQQEGQIRSIPAARSTRLMRRVFGSLDRE
jgi:hypothetical protein